MDVAVLFFHQEKADAKPVRPLTKNALDFEVLNTEILQYYKNSFPQIKK